MELLPIELLLPSFPTIPPPQHHGNGLAALPPICPEPCAPPARRRSGGDQVPPTVLQPKPSQQFCSPLMKRRL